MQRIREASIAAIMLTLLVTPLVDAASPDCSVGRLTTEHITVVVDAGDVYLCLDAHGSPSTQTAAVCGEGRLMANGAIGCISNLSGRHNCARDFELAVGDPCWLTVVNPGQDPKCTLFEGFVDYNKGCLLT